LPNLAEGSGPCRCEPAAEHPKSCTGARRVFKEVQPHLRLCLGGLHDLRTAARTQSSSTELKGSRSWATLCGDAPGGGLASQASALAWTNSRHCRMCSSVVAIRRRACSTCPGGRAAEAAGWPSESHAWPGLGCGGVPDSPCRFWPMLCAPPTSELGRGRTALKTWRMLFQKTGSILFIGVYVDISKRRSKYLPCCR